MLALELSLPHDSLNALLRLPILASRFLPF